MLALLAFPAHGALGEPDTQNMVNHVPAPLGGSMQSDKVPSNNLVLLSRFQKLTRKSIANPPMQQYLELNKTEKVRTQEKTVHNEIKRLHLLDSALASPALWFNLLSPCYTFPHLFPSSYFF